MLRRAALAAVLGACCFGALAQGGPAGAPCEAAAGRVLEVGPGKDYPVPSAAAAAARDGDVVRIAAGDYRGDVAVWSARNLTLCGVGGRARLYADGRSAQGKAIWVVGGADVTIQDVEFHGARVPSKNGAGIRSENTGRLTIRRCGFYDNENGILSGRNPAAVEIEHSEFARNGHGDGFSHNLYIGHAQRLTVRASMFREAKVGHNLKSRAAENVIENSYLLDGAEGNSSYLADFPNGGVVTLRGNLFHKGPRAQNPNAISFGAEGLEGETQTLTMVHNTLVMDFPGGSFLAVRPGAHAVTLSANLLAGSGAPTLVTGGFAPHRIDADRNVVLEAAQLPNAGRVAAPDFWPDAAARGRLRLDDVPDPAYLSDSPQPYALRPIEGHERLVGALQRAP